MAEMMPIPKLGETVKTVVDDQATDKIIELASLPPTKEPLSPKTTEQEDITAASQRRVNLIWEHTQAIIAIMVVMTNMVVGAFQGIKGVPHGDYPFILSSSLFLIVGFYFSRTNHTATGGVGPKLDIPQKYTGR